MALIFSFFILICGITLYIIADNDTKKLYLPIKEQAYHLLSLECNKQPCVAKGHIEYIETQSSHIVKGAIFVAPSIYVYKYMFEVDGNTYNKKLLVFGKSSGMKYLPHTKNMLGKKLPEKILYDPNNPLISLPEGYAKALPKIPNPYDIDKKNGIIYIVFSLMIFIIAFIKSKSKKITTS